MASQKKKQQVEEVSSLLKESQNFALIAFRKVPHTTLENIRRELKQNQSKLRIVKKALLTKVVNKLANADKSLKEFQKAMPVKDETGLLILGEDYIKGLGSFFKFTQADTNLSFKLGFLDKKVFSKEDIEEIAKLPPRERLIANLIALLKAPSQNFVHNLQFNLSKFVFVLKRKGS